MKGYRTKLRGGDEWDAFTEWRKVLSWSHRGLRRIKRRHNKRERKLIKEEFGEVTEFPIGRRFNISGEAQRIRVEEEGISRFFLSGESAQRWIDKKHKQIIKKALSEGKPVPEEVLQDYPDLAKTKGHLSA